ncbi:MAG: sulfatase [Balneolaceae bacterium]
MKQQKSGFKNGCQLVVIAGMVLFVSIGCTQATGNTVDAPNIIIIFTDDQGYVDVGSYGAEGYETPNLDRMADEGMRFTSFYVAASVCTPSRAALLTGRYPMRTGLPSVIFPRHEIGLNSDELTLAELLSQENYATQAIGKWHLGAHPDFFPTNHGFDHFFGIPYSSDMSPRPENNPREEARKDFPLLPLIEDTTIVEREPDQRQLIKRYTEHAVDFIDARQEQPFFLYFAHSLPHVPLHVSEQFRGSTELGLYGDVINEIDWSVGEIIQALEERDLRENTLVIFTSDNGPWLVFGDHGGSAGNLREGKITTFEGGHRVPAIASWPGQIPAGVVSDEVATTMDLLPTIAGLAGANLPDDLVIDGYDIWPILSGEEGVKSPYEENPLYYYLDENLEAVRFGPWKLHIAHEFLGVGEAGQGGEFGEYETREIEQSLFNLRDDPGETNNVADEHPQIVEKLMELIEQGRNELGDAEAGIRGTQQGEPGRVDQYWQILDE